MWISAGRFIRFAKAMTFFVPSTLVRSADSSGGLNVTRPDELMSTSMSLATRSATSSDIPRLPIAAVAEPGMASDTMSARRRSKRSLTAPPTSRSKTCGTIQATPTSASAVGTFEIAYTCHAIATM